LSDKFFLLFTMAACSVWLPVTSLSFQSHYVIIMKLLHFFNVVLTLINIFSNTGPVERLFVRDKVEIKGGCFIGGIERRS